MSAGEVPVTVVPWFAPDQQPGLNDFWQVYEDNQMQIFEEITQAVATHPVFGPMVTARPLEDRTRENRVSTDRLRRAIAGDWSTYESQLRKQGAAYAIAGIPFSSWNDVLRPFSRIVLPKIVRAYRDDPVRMAAAISSMEELLDHALVVLAEEYFGTREQALRESEQALREAIKVRDDFVAVAGHELRTPLTTLLMQVEAILRSIPGTDAPHRLSERLQRAFASGKRMEKLTNQLLDVTRITAGRLRLEPEPCDLVALAREVVARFVEADHRNITVTGAPRIDGQWDRSRMDQVITNLLSNALKFGQGKPIEVSLVVEGSEAVLRVFDQGVGIAEEHHGRLFERFERASAAREFGGLGLGLWITRQLAEASGGRIQLASTPGEGSTFSVYLPLAQAN